MSLRIAIAAISLIAAVLSMFVRTAAASEGEEEARLLKDAQATFSPLPHDFATHEFPVTPERVELGRQLFFDPRVSVDGTSSCARCHQAALYATDALVQSHGARNKVLLRNAPTVLNTALQFKQQWAGEFENVEAQATHALNAPGLGNPDAATALARINAIPGYVEQFRAAFPDQPDPITAENYGKAVGAYERTLVIPSRFDAYLRGNTDALSQDEQHGLRLFLETGCADCHNGAGIGGSEFEKFGVFADFRKQIGGNPDDQGRFGVTKDPTDKDVFKVPSLRNVAMTAPYFHTGTVAHLETAVRVMARVQLDKTLSDDEAKAIVAFLRSLTGTRPAGFETAPMLPAGFVPYK
ncbi:MAG: cytochrome-c peroxidase [Pirellula sp.]|nr:cytochrome-c peroxidase [Pirellula sp.]